MKYIVKERYPKACTENKVAAFELQSGATLFCYAASRQHEDREYLIYRLAGRSNGVNQKRTDQHLATYRNGHSYDNGSSLLTASGSVIHS